MAAPSFASAAAGKAESKEPLTPGGAHRELIKKVPNPFENNSPWTPYEIFKAVLLGPTLFPIRFVLILVVWTFMSILCRLAVSCGGTRLIDDRGCLRHEEPLPGWRRAILWPVGACLRIYLWCVGFWYIKVDDRRKPTKQFAGFICEGDDLEKKTMTVVQAQAHCLRLPGCKGFCYKGGPAEKGAVEITFKSKFVLAKDDRSEGFTAYRVQPKPGIIVGASHHAPFDHIVAGYFFPPLPSFVGQAGLIEGLMGCLNGGPAIASQTIFVKTGEKSSREACKDAIAVRAGESWTGPPTLIFPEGTNTNGKVLIQFKPGPFLPGKPVQPMALKYTNKHFCLGWTGRFAHNFMLLFVRAMLQFANHVEVVLFEPYVPNEEEIADAQLFANNVRAMMAKEMDVPTTEHSYTDAKFSLKAIRANVAQDFEFEDLKQHYGISADNLIQWLENFKKMDKDRSGFIDEGEFRAAMASAGPSMSKPEVVRSIFQLFDTDQTGHLSYRQCIQALAMVGFEEDTSGRNNVCFALCDPQEGKVAKGVLSKILEESWGGEQKALTAILASCPDHLDFDAFAKFAGQSEHVYLAILTNLPEIARLGVDGLGPPTTPKAGEVEMLPKV